MKEQGADSDVWIADNEWILRRAKTDEVREWFGKEAALVPALTQLLSAAVPQFELLCLERGLVGYRIIRGEPLSDALLQRHPQKVGSELGGFIARLHSFDVTDAVALGVPVMPPGGLFPRDPPFRPGATAAEMGWREVFAHARSQITTAFAPYLSRAQVGALGVVFDAVLDDSNALDFVPTLVHTELKPEHTLFDAEGRLVGVIDWSDACISDPALDIPLGLTLPPAAAASLVDAYGPELDVAARNRVRVYRSVVAYVELLDGDTLRDDTIKAEAVASLRGLIA